jgi:hypothetical protein
MDEYTDAAQLRERFSLLTFLLAGVTAVNNDNHHPTLKTVSRRSIHERVSYMKIKKTSHAILMEAVTALLIQDTEVLASMASTSSSIVTLKAPEPLTEEIIRKEILGALYPQQALLDYGEMLPDNNPDDRLVEGDKIADLEHLYTFHNPNQKIEMDPAHGMDRCIAVPIGRSYWDDVLVAKSGFIFPESGS